MSSWVKFRNTYLQAPWLFPLVIGDRQYENVLHGRPRTFLDKVQRGFERALWFWPRVIDAAPWADGATGRLQTPDNYAELDQHGRMLLDWVMRVCPDRDAKLLDVGCNRGRHIVYLAGQGYRNITGVDAMKSALEAFKQSAPDVFNRMEIHHNLFQRFLSQQPDGRFDLTYSHGATIEIVHPSFDIVAHISRVTKRYVCLFLIEEGPFARHWIRQFASHGFVLEYGERPVKGTGASMLVLRRAKMR